MNIDCPNPCVVCPTEISVENFSSEAPDIDFFLARSYGGLQGATVLGDFNRGGPDEPVGGDPDPPPLGGGGENTIVTTCESETSQDDANTCALNKWLDEGVRKNWPIPKNNPNNFFSSTTQNCNEKCTPNNGAIIRAGAITATSQALADQIAKYYACQRTLCGNTLQTCTVLCPDGSPFTLAVLPGKFFAINQATANRIALQNTCIIARSNIVCLSPLTLTNGCLGSPFLAFVAALSRNEVQFSVSSGALPTGLVLVDGPGNRGAIGGVPTAVGEYDFTLIAQAGFFQMSKSYTITINDISSPGQLPDATSGVPYSTALVVGGPTTGQLLWEVKSGNLPIGMTLDQNTGVISGTPTDVVDFTYEFVITVSDGH